MKKIIFFIPGLSGGGAEKVLCNLVNNMDQSKFDITVQTTEFCDPNLYLAAGIHYKAINRCRSSIGKKLFSYFFRAMAEWKMAYRLWVKGDYDIEIAYVETEATKIIAQSTNKNAKKLAWVHCDLSKKDPSGTSADKVREWYRKFDRIVCVSKDVESGFHTYLGDEFNTVVVPNVIDEDEILKKSEEPIDTVINHPAIMAVGRLSYEKGADRLLDACAKLAEAQLPFSLYLIGDGPEKEKLQQQVEEQKLKDSVHFLGFQKNPYPFMKRADIIVCPSRYEGLSTVAIESLMLGKVFVTTPCGGMKEILGDSEFGIITAMSSEALADGMERLMTDSELLANYKEKSLIRGREFYKSAIVNQTQNFFEEIG